MKTYESTITIEERTYPIRVDCFGEGPIPILICGHAEIYAQILEQAFQESDLLGKYRFFVPRSYWCVDAPLANIPEIVDQLTLVDLARHLEEIRQDLVRRELLVTKEGKIGIYSHSFFSALAFHYAAWYPESTLFIEAEGAPPYNTEQWGTEKALFFKGNASDERKQALEIQEISPGSSAVDQKSMLNFPSFRDAYHRMNPTLWFDFKQDHRQRIWGNKQLNMAIMQRYFILLEGYDCRNIMNKVSCPIHLSLGAFDTAVPPYLWIDSPKKGGIGLFKSKKSIKNRDYFIHVGSGHWPFLEEPQRCCEEFNNFIDKMVLPNEPIDYSKTGNNQVNYSVTLVEAKL